MAKSSTQCGLIKIQGEIDSIGDKILTDSHLDSHLDRLMYQFHSRVFVFVVIKMMTNTPGT